MFPDFPKKFINFPQKFTNSSKKFINFYFPTIMRPQVYCRENSQTPF